MLLFIQLDIILKLKENELEFMRRRLTWITKEKEKQKETQRHQASRDKIIKSFEF